MKKLILFGLIPHAYSKPFSKDIFNLCADQGLCTSGSLTDVQTSIDTGIATIGGTSGYMSEDTLHFGCGIEATFGSFAGEDDNIVSLKIILCPYTRTDLNGGVGMSGTAGESISLFMASQSQSGLVLGDIKTVMCPGYDPSYIFQISGRYESEPSNDKIGLINIGINCRDEYDANISGMTMAIISGKGTLITGPSDIALPPNYLMCGIKGQAALSGASTSAGKAWGLNKLSMLACEVFVSIPPPYKHSWCTNVNTYSISSVVATADISVVKFTDALLEYPTPDCKLFESGCITPITQDPSKYTWYTTYARVDSTGILTINRQVTTDVQYLVCFKCWTGYQFHQEELVITVGDVNNICIQGTTTFTDTTSLTYQLFVGQSGTDAYTFINPTSSSTGCSIIQNQAVVNLSPSLPHPRISMGSSATKFNLDSALLTSVETVLFKIKSTFTNNVVHVSPELSMVVSCRPTYTITAQAATVQYIKHNGGTADGFTLPVYQSQFSACPPNLFEPSLQLATFIAYPDLPPVNDNSNLIRPSDPTIHQIIDFFIRVTLLGNYKDIFGPYKLIIGCVQGQVSFNDSALLVDQKSIQIGDSTQEVYTFEFPTSTRSWCTVISTEIVEATGGGTQQLIGSGMQPFSKYSITSSNTPMSLNFKIKSTFQNSLTFTSRLLTFNILGQNCNSDITELLNIDNQFIKHDGGLSDGYTIPLYIPSLPGCEVTSLSISSTMNYYTKSPDLIQPITIEGRNITRPKLQNKHISYQFYIRVILKGGIQKYFGPKTLNVGCLSEDLTIKDSPNLIPAISVPLGSDNLKVYQFKEPQASRTWCIPESNEIVRINGDSWQGEVKLIGSGQQPFKYFDLLSTYNEEEIIFAVKSLFLNSIEHVSSAINISIEQQPVISTETETNGTTIQTTSQASQNSSFANNTFNSAQHHEQKPFYFSISKIRNDGNIKLRFTVPMFDQKKGFNISMINSESIEIMLLTQDYGLGRSIVVGQSNSSLAHRQLQQINISQFNFTWWPIEYLGKDLEIKLNFSDPLLVSQNPQISDQLVVKLIDESIFMPVQSFYKLKRNQTIKRMTKQMKNDTATQTMIVSAQSFKTTMDTVMSVSALMNIFTAAALTQILGMMNVLQIMCFQTMMNIHYPSNAQYLASMVIRILNIDILDPDLINDQIFDFSKDENIIETIEELEQDSKYRNLLISQFQDMDFETFNPILNLGGIFIVILAYILNLVGVYLLSGISYLLKRNKSQSFEGGEQASDKIDRFVKNQKKTLFFNSLIIIVFESILQLTTSSILFAQEPSELIQVGEQSFIMQFTEICSVIIEVICIFLLLFLIYFAYKILVSQKKSKEYHTENAKVKFLYINLKFKLKQALIYNFVYIFRRISMSFMFVYMTDFSGIQIQISLLMNLFICIYLGQIEPFRERQQNNIEFLNEIQILCLTINLVIFTDFVGDIDVQYDVGGWIYIGIMSLCILFNLYYIFKAMCNSLLLVCIKYKNRCAHKYCNKKAKPIMAVNKSPQQDIFQTNQNIPNIVMINQNQTFHKKKQFTFGENLNVISSKLENFIDSQEKIIDYKIQQVIELSREQLMDSFRSNFIFKTEIAQFFEPLLCKLNPTERIRLFYEFRGYLFYKKMFLGRIINKYKKLHMETMNEHKQWYFHYYCEDMKDQITEELMEIIQNYFDSEQFKQTAISEEMNWKDIKDSNRLGKQYKNEICKPLQHQLLQLKYSTQIEDPMYVIEYYDSSDSDSEDSFDGEYLENMKSPQRKSKLLSEHTIKQTTNIVTPRVKEFYHDLRMIWCHKLVSLRNKGVSELNVESIQKKLNYQNRMDHDKWKLSVYIEIIKIFKSYECVQYFEEIIIE